MSATRQIISSKQIEVLPLLRRDFDEYGAAAPLFRRQSAIAQLLLHAIRLRVGLVDLVDRNDDRHTRRLGVIDCFERLRHHPIVGGDNDDDNVGHLGAARTHAGERFVAGSIEEDDLAAGGRRTFLGEPHLVCADVLGDASGFARGDIGFANGVQQ